MAATPRASWGTVRVRVTIAATLVVTFALVVSSWFVVRAVRSSLREDLRTESALALADALERFETRGPSNPLPVPSPSGFVIVAVQDDGRIRDGSPGLTARTWASFVGDASQDPAIVGRNGRPFPRAIAGEQHIWFVAGRIFNFIPVQINGAPGYLVAAGTQRTIESSVKTVTSALTWTVPGLILFMGLVAWGVTGRALRPVEKIRRDVAEISATNIEQRVYEPRARDEVGRLARTMNQMLDRLHSSSTRQRQFVSDASHELRSPVAAIRATGEVALSHPEAADWPAVVERILTEDARMERIVGDLLDLARADEGTIPTTMVDLDDIVFDEATQTHRPDVAVHSDHVSAGRVRGSREQLTRIVRNLLDNATRHARSQVRVTLTTDDAVYLTVEDDGPGIPTEDRERVFERFTRLDDGRARDAGGLGLGLAMVRANAEHHGGSVAILDPVAADYPGARVVVRLPIPNASVDPVEPLDLPGHRGAAVGAEDLAGHERGALGDQEQD